MMAIVCRENWSNCYFLATIISLGVFENVDGVLADVATQGTFQQI
jgi:hypothetical protein